MTNIKVVTPIRYLGHIHDIDVLVSKLEGATSYDSSYFIFTLRDTVKESKWTSLMDLLGRVPSFEKRVSMLEEEIDSHPQMIKLHNYKKHINIFVVEGK